MSESFNVLADATEDNSKLGAKIIDVAHRNANEELVPAVGHQSAEFLRKIDEGLGDGGESNKPPNDGDDSDADDGETSGNEDQDGDDSPGAYDDSRAPLPSEPDSRDLVYKYDSKQPHGPHVDLRDLCPPVYVQGQMGSCTAQAVAAAFEFEVRKQHLPHFSPSRLFIWYKARAMSTDRDAVKKNVGTSLRDAIKSLDFKAHGGVCSESDWSYEVGKFNKKTHFFVQGAKAAKQPPKTVEQHSHQHTATSYYTFPAGNDLQKRLINCLHQGYPFVFGMKTYKLLQSGVGKDGKGLRMPTPQDKKNGEHRHSLLAVGYIQEEKVFIVRNSWSANWGQGGYFYMPYGYLQYCHDFWTIRVVNSKLVGK
ncbi:hypothetical protein VNI00_018302 [Paramarasmius palmivorus]|uniref:Peptidase C1A papain C-terminal domain-containing protein n=1 Tax=Paramarasmius palmivorus TaxID=297713 RepID=A0AAW0AYU6_9AGAR